MKRKIKYLIGIDEVGRGPLAGPVCVCAFLIDLKNRRKVYSKLKGITDSKRLSKKRREEYFEKIKELKKNTEYLGLDFKFTFVSAKIIDKKGIVFAIQKALNKSLKKLNVKEDECKILLDGNLHAPKTFLNQKTIIKGDLKEKVISAASIIAKVSRDEKMKRLAKKYPEYIFQNNKGYGTLEHRKAIKKFGLSTEHRRSFCGRI